MMEQQTQRLQWFSTFIRSSIKWTEWSLALRTPRLGMSIWNERSLESHCETDSSNESVNGNRCVRSLESTARTYIDQTQSQCGKYDNTYACRKQNKCCVWGLRMHKTYALNTMFCWYNKPKHIHAWNEQTHLFQTWNIFQLWTNLACANIDIWCETDTSYHCILWVCAFH